MTRSPDPTSSRYRKTVLITGANGFVGRALDETLSSAGFTARRAVRTSNSAHDNSYFAVGDIGPETDWSEALSDVDGIVHLAARTHVVHERHEDPTAEFERVNVTGTLHLAKAAMESGVRRFVYVSSATVNGGRSIAAPFAETDEPEPVTDYAKSKWKSEEMLTELARGSGMEVVVLRPPLVYGPGVKANFLSLMKLADSGLPLPLASVENRRSLVYVGNLTDAISTCLTHPAAAGETFLVSDGEDVSTPDLIRRIATTLGGSARLVPFPPALLGLVGRAVGKGDRLGKLTDSLAIDTTKIRDVLGWKPPHSMRDGLRETAAWFRRGY